MKWVWNSQFKMKFLYSLFQNGPYCKLILLFTKYFRLTNYIWMFCEGFYLHRLISSAFAEERSLVLFYVIGWGKYNFFIETDRLLRYGWKNVVCNNYNICFQLYEGGQKICLCSNFYFPEEHFHVFSYSFLLFSKFWCENKYFISYFILEVFKQSF
jgi:hypothetical protein